MKRAQKGNQNQVKAPHFFYAAVGTASRKCPCEVLQGQELAS